MSIAAIRSGSLTGVWVVLILFASFSFRSPVDAGPTAKRHLLTSDSGPRLIAIDADLAWPLELTDGSVQYRLAAFNPKDENTYVPSSAYSHQVVTRRVAPVYVAPGVPPAPFKSPSIFIALRKLII